MRLVGYWNVCRTEKIDERISCLVENRDFPAVRGAGWSVACLDQKNSAISAVEIGDEKQATGLAVGRIFLGDSSVTRVTSGSRRLSLDSFSEQSTIASNRAWGQFFAASVDPDTQNLSLVRDQIGIGSGFFTKHEGGYLFASQLADLVDMRGTGWTYNWKNFTLGVLYGPTHQESTSIDDVYQLLPGQLIQITPNGIKSRIVWNSFEIAREQEYLPEPDETRDRIVQCVNAWVGSSRGVFSDLSGGLDSSTITWAARHSGHDVIANFIFDKNHRSANELEYSQAVASQLEIKVSLIESEDIFPLAPLDFNYGRSNFAYIAELLRQRKYYKKRELAEDRVILTGHGGDHVFQAGASDRPELHDFYLRYGLRKWWERASQISALDGTSVMVLLGRTILQEVNRRKIPLPQSLSAKIKLRGWETPSWVIPEWSLSPSCEAQINAAINPYNIRLPAGRMVQATSVATVTHEMDQEFNSSVSHPIACPMLSLPLVELALRTPIDSLINLYNDRLIVRQAMSTALPSQIVKRQTKGNYTGFHLRATQRYLKRAEELICDGVLAQQGVIDSRLARQDLYKIVGGNHHLMKKLTQLLAAELWLQQWNYART